MSGQLESPHFYREGDLVRAVDGSHGSVAEASALFALIAWEDGSRDEIDQFDPTILVVERASEE